MTMDIEVFSTKNASLCKISVESSSTVGEVKKRIANAVPGLNENRQSLRQELRGKDMKNSLVLSTLQFTNNNLYVKDLGPQISWSAVFIAEYFGPLVVYSIFAFRPSLIYGADAGQLSTSAFYAWMCWSAHYAKRLLETVLVHRFSHGTMPLMNLFKNCSYYWGFAAFVAYHVNHPLYTAPNSFLSIFGLALFVLSELGNLSIHLLLRNLRPPGTSVRKIPVPNANPLTSLFHFVSCPNYTFEFGAWLGFTLMTSCIPAALFAFAGMFQMTIWALGKHKNYRKEFTTYPRNRKAILPFLI